MRDKGQIVLIRHASIASRGRLCGRTDCAIGPVDLDRISPLAQSVSDLPFWYGSPALRCQQTLERLFPQKSADVLDNRLWEQDFGLWEDTPFSELPDIGTLSSDELYQYQPPGGESFAQLYERASPCFDDIVTTAQSQSVGVMAHAGIIRAFLGHVLGRPQAGLNFMIDELSATKILVSDAGQFTVRSVNQML